VTEDTGIGDPSASTPDKGKLSLEEITTKIRDFFLELNEADPENIYD
jgi:creatinine amidohydrolase